MDKHLADQKIRGRRMVIEEVIDSSDELSAPTATDSAPVEEPETRASKPMTNGSAVNGTPEGEMSESMAASDSADRLSGDAATTKSTAGKDSMPGGKASLTEGDNSVGTAPTNTNGQQLRVGDSSGDAEINGTDPVSVDSGKTGSSEQPRRFADKALPDAAPAAAKSSDSSAVAPPPVLEAPPPALTPKIATLKDAGNELFRAGQYAEALGKYDRAVELVKGLPRSFCFV